MAEDKRRQERAARINRRALNYINGDISLDTFFMLEQLDNEEEADIVEALAKERDRKEAEAERAERRKEADKLRSLQEIDAEESEPEPTRPALKSEPRVPELVNMTKEEFDALSFGEQMQLYEFAPNRVREIIEQRPAYMDISNPKPRQPQASDYKNLTLEQFKKMNYRELQTLADTDRELYNKLAAEDLGREI